MALYRLADVLGWAAQTMTQVVKDTVQYENRELRILHNRDLIIQYIQRIHQQESLHLSQSAVSMVRPRQHSLPLVNPTISLPSECDQTDFSLTNTNSSTTLSLPPPLAIIFDLDGTLTMPGAIDYTLMRQELQLLDRSKDIIDYINDHLQAEAQQQAWEIVERIEMNACKLQTLRPHTITLLQQLRLHKIRLAISTRNCPEALDYFFNSYGKDLPLTLFHTLQTRNVIKHEGKFVNKPNPLLATSILHSWEITTTGQQASVYFIGDSLDDMLCGKHAGCSTILVLTDYNQELQQQYPQIIDYTISTFEELINLWKL
jgi:phosphoglycolate phosphatase-like HAD superfamily hydrolase